MKLKISLFNILKNMKPPNFRNTAVAMISAGIVITVSALVISCTLLYSEEYAMTQTDHYNGEDFFNPEPTEVMIKNDNKSKDDDSEGFSPFEMIFPPEGRIPAKPLPSLKFNELSLIEDSYAWFGHSTLMLRTGGNTLMIDPVFHRASPVPVGGKPFEMENPLEITDLPEIDLVCISHDHYDHLDKRGIKKIDSKVGHYVVPLKVKSILTGWGINENKITELDWYEETSFQGLTVILTPSRHFSGRSLTNRYSTLWGGYIIESDSRKIYFSGDGGYSQEFKKIGRNYGPFDIAFMENGAYNEAWNQIHMFPEQSVQAAIDVNAQVAVPVHWGKFNLSVHDWDEPIKRFIQEADNKELPIATPMIGEVFTLDNIPHRTWWEDPDL